MLLAVSSLLCHGNSIGFWRDYVSIFTYRGKGELNNKHTYQGPPSPFLGLPEQTEVKRGGQPLQYWLFPQLEVVTRAGVREKIVELIDPRQLRVCQWH